MVKLVNASTMRLRGDGHRWVGGATHITKGAAAYAILRRAIFTDEIPTRTALDEVELMAHYGLGRTPLREALKRLAQEELIVWEPHRTPYVREISAYDLRHLYDARLLLEVPIAKLAAERATPRDLGRLKQLSTALIEACERGETYEAVELDHAFHLAIAESTQNRFLVKAVHDLNSGSLRLWFASLKQFGLSSEDHEGVVEAIAERNAERAEHLIRHHIDESYEYVVAAILPAGARRSELSPTSSVGR